MPIRTDRPRRLSVLRLFRPSLGSSRHRLRQAQPSNPLQNRPEQSLGHGHFCHLEDYVPRVRDDLRSNLDEILPQRRQRPVLHGARQRQPTQEVAQVVRQGEQLEADLVVHEVMAGQVVHFTAFLPSLIHCSAVPRPL